MSPTSNQIGPNDPSKNSGEGGIEEHQSDKNDNSQRQPLRDEEEDAGQNNVSVRYKNLAQSLKKIPQILKPPEEKQQKPGIYTIEDLKDLKYLLLSEVAIPLNTNILRIALNF